ncbi:MAG TPA: hypothetical protein VK191_16035 [Symbiobacteriaceae bacterium]|nr:hypothetical protein [Symbiobacteriaceae bacterium]
MERPSHDPLEQAAAEVAEAIQSYRADVERLFRGEGPTEAVFRWIDPSFQAYYGIPRVNDKLVAYSEAEEKAGFIEAAAAYSVRGGAPMTLPWMRLIARSPNEVMAAYEICQIGPRFWDRALVLEVWRRGADSTWRVIRQTMEQEERRSPTDDQPRSPVPMVTI